MGKHYEGTCKHGKVVFAAIANTPIEQAECASEIKKLVKDGFQVELVEGAIGDWCEYEAKCKKCPIETGKSQLSLLAGL